MTRQNKIIIAVIFIVIILLIGIGYASLANNFLSINGKVLVSAEQENFKVYYTGEVAKNYVSENYITVEATPVAQAQNATVNILGLSKKGDAGYAILEIENGSNDIDSEITVTAEIEESDMFKVDIIMCDREGTAINNFIVASGEKTYVKVFAELLKTPTNVMQTTIVAKVTAVPKSTVEEGENPEIPENPNVETDIFSEHYTQAEEKMQTMTLDEKIGQMFIIGTSSSTNYTTLNQYPFGGHLYLLSSFKDSSGQILKVDAVKQQIMTSQQTAKIPLIMSIDEEGETVSRLNSTLVPELGIEPFKNSSDVYNAGGLEAIRNDTINKSRVLKDLGFNLNFAPDVDIADEGFYIYKRTLKQDATTTAEFAKTVIETSKGTGVSYSMKHFPGYGNSTDTHSGFSTDNRELSEFENKDLIPFKAGIKANAEIIMVSHNIVTCIDEEDPASISKPIHDYLRNDMGYTGIIITDAINMDAIAKKYSTRDSVIKSIKAGNDIICLVMDEGQQDVTGGETLTYAGIIKYVSDAVSNGQISEETINIAVKRIIAWKYYKGLM